MSEISERVLDLINNANNKQAARKVALEYARKLQDLTRLYDPGYSDYVMVVFAEHDGSFGLEWWTNFGEVDYAIDLGSSIFEASQRVRLEHEARLHNHVIAKNNKGYQLVTQGWGRSPVVKSIYLGLDIDTALIVLDAIYREEEVMDAFDSFYQLA